MAHSLEAVQEEDTFHTRGHKTDTKACFVVNGRDQSPDAKQMVKGVFVHLGHDHASGKEACQPPTPGPKRVWSTERREINLLPLELLLLHPGIGVLGDEVDALLHKGAPAVEMDHCRVITAKGMDISLKSVHPRGFTK